MGRSKRIAIVGGGPSGVATAKAILAEFEEVTVDIFEQQASFGGVWNYTDGLIGTIDVPQTNPNQPLPEPVWRSSQSGLDKDQSYGTVQAAFVSPMYKKLETNIPHCLMKYSDAPSLEESQLFPSREAVTKYLEEYAADLRPLVRFQTQVTDIRLKSRTEGWVVQFRDLAHPHATSQGDYDAVIVASGHYTVPKIPDIKGIREWSGFNQGAIRHSKFYRTPEPFTDKKVIIVGNSASGIDIACQIATVSKHPILNSTRSESALTYEAKYKENVPEIAEFLHPGHANRAVRFSDDRVETDIDAVLFCTGYLYAFPFLSSLSPELISDGERVQNLYEHMWYIPEPTLVFVGLPSKIIPFRTVEAQSSVIGAVLGERLDLPPKTVMRKWEGDVIEKHGTRHFHVLPFPKDLEYHNKLIMWASTARSSLTKRVPPRWTAKEMWLRERFPAIKRAFADKGEERYQVRTVEQLGFDYGAWLKDQ